MAGGQGRCLEVILLNHGRGPIACIRVTQNSILLGPGSPSLPPGYYLTHVEALEFVGVASIVVR